MAIPTDDVDASPAQKVSSWIQASLIPAPQNEFPEVLHSFMVLHAGSMQAALKVLSPGTQASNHTSLRKLQN